MFNSEIKTYKTIGGARIAAAQFMRHGAKRANVFFKHRTDKRFKISVVPAVFVIH